MDDGWIVCVKINETLEDLATPRLEDLGFERSLQSLFQILLQCAGRHEFGHEDDALSAVGGL